MKYLLLVFIFAGCSQKVPYCIAENGTTYVFVDDKSEIARAANIEIGCGE